MTSPDYQNGSQVEYTAADMSNHLLSISACVLSTTVVPTTSGPRLALTIRTPSTTLTVLLEALEARQWADQITRSAHALPVAGEVVS